MKRRTVAKELTDAGRVSLNGRPAKASAEVGVGDRIRLRLGSSDLEAVVLAVPPSARPPRGAPLVEVVERRSREDGES